MAKIIVIDDEADMRAMLEQALTIAGHKVVTAADGQEGASLFRAVGADLLMTDLVMPNQEGLETIIELRRDYPNINIIAMSGRTGAEIMLTIARRLGASQVLQKPFSSEQLLSVIGKALRLEPRRA